MGLTFLDTMLIDAARSGDRVAMEKLLAVCQPDIRRYAMQHCMISDVDDAVQEVLLIIARKISAFNILAAFSSWLFKTVQRECRRLGRKALNYDPYEEEALEKWLFAQSEGQLLYELLDVIDTLPREFRDVLLLKDFQQLANKEIANKLSISVAAVKSRLHRARKMTRAMLLN